MKLIIIAAVMWLGLGLLIIVLTLCCNDRGPANTAYGRYTRKQKRELEKILYNLITIWALPIVAPIAYYILLGLIIFLRWCVS